MGRATDRDANLVLVLVLDLDLVLAFDRATRGRSSSSSRSRSNARSRGRAGSSEARLIGQELAPKAAGGRVLDLAALLLPLETMRLAVPIWGDRVSPVLDVARRLVLVEVEGGRAISRMEHDLVRVDHVVAATQLGVDVVICGAVSVELERRLVAAGVTVIGNVCGSVEEVVHAFLTGTLDDGRLTMPGCRTPGQGRVRDDRRRQGLRPPPVAPPRARPREAPGSREVGAGLGGSITTAPRGHRR